MTFLNSWALAIGAAALIVPVLIHRLTAARPQPRPLSTLRFVEQIVRERRTSHRVRDWAVLALRTAAVGFLAWAFARPLIGEGVGPAGGNGEIIRVIVLDVSQSMAARDESGVETFERARAVAARYLSGPADLRADLVLAGGRCRAVFGRPGSHTAGLREALAGISPVPARANLQAALGMAGRILADAPRPGRRELVVISDFQETDWSAVNWTEVPADTLIHLESAASGTSPENLAVLSVQPAAGIEIHEPASVIIRVGNFSPRLRTAEVVVETGSTVRRLRTEVPARGTAELTCSLVFDEPGWMTGTARLAENADALPADDCRPFVVEVRRSSGPLIVTRQKGKAANESSRLLAWALSPLEGSHGSEPVRRLAPEQLSPAALAGTRLIVLDHPGKMEPEEVDLLADWLCRGRALLYLTAEPIDAANLALLTEAADGDLGLPVVFEPMSDGQVRRHARLGNLRSDRPPLRELGEALASLLEPVRFGGGLHSRKTADRPPDEVIASFDDGSAALVLGACGAGRLAVLNTDLEAGTLPASPAFVVLLGELVDHLTAGPAPDTPCLSGEPLAVELPVEFGPSAGLTIVDADGAAVADADLIDTPSGIRLIWPAAGKPGVCRLLKDDRCVYAWACGIPPAECDLSRLSPRQVSPPPVGERPVYSPVGRGNAAAGEELWIYPALACLLCLLAEIIVLGLYRA